MYASWPHKVHRNGISCGMLNEMFSERLSGVVGCILTNPACLEMYKSLLQSGYQMDGERGR